MKLQSIAAVLLGAASLLSSTVTAQAAESTTEKINYPRSITLTYEDLSAKKPKPSPLATILYDPSTLRSTFSSWTPPNIDSTLKSNSKEPQSAPLLRILLPNGSSTIASLNTFDTNLSQNITLWVSSSPGATNGEITSASINSITPPPISQEEEDLRKKEERLRARGKPVPPRAPPKNKKAREEAAARAAAGPQVRVNLLVGGKGVEPRLLTRKPPQIDGEGREVVQEEVVEKTFFQKYWYFFLIGAFLLMSGGAGGDK